MLDWIMKYWLGCLFGFLAALASSFVTWLLSKIKRDKKIDALSEEIEELKNNHQELQNSNAEVRNLLEKLIVANNATQYDKLYYLHKTFIKQGWISIDDMRNVRNIYESYHALGGNGHGTALFKALEELPSYPKEEEKNSD